MQSDRPISVTSPLGEDVLLFYRMSAAESLGRLFDFDLDVLSEDHDIKLEDLLGQPMAVHLDLPGGGKRHFHGIVNQLSFVGTVGRYAHFGIQLQPWLWMLTRTSDCRIFQNMTVPDIIKEVFRDLGFSDFEESLSGSYTAWDYCVQYRETAFNFVSRLMEQEGIYYYFKHEEDKHTLVLSDSYSSHEPVTGYEEVPFFPPEEGEESGLDRFLEWRFSQKVQSTSYTLDDYNFETPKSDIRTSATATKKHAGTDYRVFDYPGEYPDAGVGSEYVKYRMEELTGDYETHSAVGNVRGLMAGGLFSLIDHPRADQNKEYLVVSAVHSLESAGYESGDTGSGDLTYFGNVEAIDAQVPYRSPRTTPKPAAQGPQTAVVVGASGETVWTDKHGRVKVQFHWDRQGANDEDSSCWVRVSQNWAGKTWGGMFIPHIGQEVIVDFLEGDPDRPIITGRVYNADNMPPLELPAKKYESIIRDDGDNEVVMDEEGGKQFIHLRQACGNEILMNDGDGDPNIHIKQTCGNEIRMEGAGGSEGIDIRDKHGNEIVLDAVAGTITLFAPNHNSKMVLGESLKFSTDSILEEKYGKDTWLKTFGVTNELFVGVKFAESLAASFSTTNGFEYKRNYAYVRERGHSKQDKIISKGLKLDSQTMTEVIGGYGDSDFCKITLSEHAPQINIESGEAKIGLDLDGKIKISTPKEIEIVAGGNLDIKSEGIIKIGKGIVMHPNGVTAVKKAASQPNIDAEG